ncbi:exonuclease subunit SbcD [Pelagibaculum spongiae]|uniref:Nuclease SbcCD subunit D n=1 Tax=Pelagibaculum spongiae TaxID=2080658 RepID=A0A2V1GY83_9GAMM|nr:exonuclease subunit SbcD [Pelagibaculum spongiae]PVZ72071.1 exonuclease subunit SbcD [Pelagibaculum spongiae]
MTGTASERKYQTSQLRILHTSDWHLGQHFFGKSREEEHQLFIGWLLQKIEQQQVDVLLITGDIFDTGTPPSYARTHYNQLIVRLRKIGCQVVVLGGNHDSVTTLNESRELLACLNATVVATVDQDMSQQLVELKNRSGEVAGLLCAVPFLHQSDIAKSRAGESAQEKKQQLLSAISEHYADLFSLAQAQQQPDLPPIPVIATGYLACAGGQLSESVREIYIGALDIFPTECFPKADYIALGHLHIAQKVEGHEHIRYSGSPIPLSFDESSLAKQVCLIDFSNGELFGVKSLEIPCFRRLQSIDCRINELENVLSAIADQSTADPLTPWLEITVGASDYLDNVQKVIQQVSEDLRLDVLQVKRHKEAVGHALNKNEGLPQLNVKDVFAACLRLEDVDEDNKKKLNSLLNQVIEKIDSDDNNDLSKTSNNYKSGESL